MIIYQQDISLHTYKLIDTSGISSSTVSGKNNNKILVEHVETNEWDLILIHYLYGLVTTFFFLLTTNMKECR